MPQMMPINWILSLLFFILIFIMFNIMNYYIFNSKINNSNIKSFPQKTNLLIWKW
uniref:ATP synthase complex subunit 8 n=1 Tax=Histia rhodope TaxID=1453155 RepID=A0A346HH04_9NEOP|nr:ATP synthase F0 subunit 8 [Histia rhodope]AXO78690.1 ATP synthase F0 subunit 8 [Histia rhodope]UNO31874.1 ATP synthase F0 subunit 8 [Histia rhodope]